MRGAVDRTKWQSRCSIGGVCNPRAFGRDGASAGSAAIGALKFELVAVGTAAVPEVRSTTRFPAGDLEVEVHRDGGQTFLVVDHRSDCDLDEPARVELWACAGQPEAEAPDLLVLANRRAQEQSGPVHTSTSVAELVQTLRSQDTRSSI